MLSFMRSLGDSHAIFKTFWICTLVQSHVAAEKHCNVFDRAEAYAKKITKLPIWPVHGLITDRPVVVGSTARASHISAEQYCNNKKWCKSPGWAAACPYAQKRASFEPLHKEHQQPAA
jgi:hypothetical protein